MLAAVLTGFDPPPAKGKAAVASSTAGGPANLGIDGARSAFEPEAFAPAVRAVVAAVMRCSRSDADVDDGVSETMRRALEGRERLRPGEPLRPWMLGIARHVALDALRKRKRERPAWVPAEPDSSGDLSALDRIPDSAPSPLENVEQADRRERVQRAMRDLPEGMREALTLFHVEGLGYESVAERMNVPLGTVATWIARGRKILTERMATHEHPGPARMSTRPDARTRTTRTP